MKSATSPATASPPEPLRITPEFCDLLRHQRLSFLASTYEAGKLIFVGCPEAGKISTHEAGAPRCMGSTVHDDGRTIWLSSRFQLWRLSRIPSTEKDEASYVSRQSWTVGDVDVHDMAVPSGSDLPVFVSARYCCIARPHPEASFEVVWKPPFVSRVAAEDRCHLNGLALRDGVPAFATAAAATDFVAGWRENRIGQGIVIEIASGEIACEGLTMPHSPRWHNGGLYLLNSGTGEFGRVDLNGGRFEPICLCPGYARGLSFHGNFALIGLSDCRENRTFQGLPLDANLKKAGFRPRCGAMMVNLATGEATQALTLGSAVREIYDVHFLSDAVRARVLPLNEGHWFKEPFLGSKQ